MKYKYLLAIIFLAGFFSGAGISQAHQPRVVFGETAVRVEEPEISKAYYGELEGRPDSFWIRSDKPFDLYANVLVPDVPGARKDISFEIKKDGESLVASDGVGFRWTNFYEPFAGDNYFKGPEYKTRAEAGSYEIKVSNPGNTGKYALAVGETESFAIGGALEAIAAIPRIKKDFFGESALSAYLNQITLLLLAIISALAGIIWLWVLAYRKKRKNNF
ncbi:MAG: hypothetical protein Q8L11_00290 [Candidatus Moranbacteria bacterium]|nr:hypothetical protein [Candidatus Moranbacteria bacterium]